MVQGVQSAEVKKVPPRMLILELNLLASFVALRLRRHPATLVFSRRIRFNSDGRMTRTNRNGDKSARVDRHSRLETIFWRVAKL